MYTRLQEVLEAALSQAAGRGVAEGDIESVLLVGGSTLLPSVQRFFIETFGRSRVRGDRPFGAVALGAARFAGGAQARDFIQHSYALRVYDPEKGKADYEILIPAGTPYPTPPDFVVREYPVRCPGGRPVDRFHLRIYEVGVHDESVRSELIQLPDGSWDWATPEEAGRREPVVCLNDENPTLGRLDPPQTPDAPQPRLRITFFVDADRYLRATVHDLHRGVRLMEAYRVVQLR